MSVRPFLNLMVRCKRKSRAPVPAVFCLLAVLALPVSAERLLIMGDSLSAAYGLASEDEGWVALLADRLADHGHTVINASVSGETTRGGVRRLPSLLSAHDPDWVLLELGGNDGLQGEPVPAITERLQAMIDQTRTAGADIILVGIRIPPNYGPRYTEPFFEQFNLLARRNDIEHFLPFLLEGIATRPDLMQNDGIHPTAAAQPLILDNVWAILPEALK